MGLILRTISTPNSGNTVTIKSSSLTWDEGDGNFVYLNELKLRLDGITP
jgi:hypothetical protein